MRTQTYSRRAIASGLSLAALASPAVAFPTLAAVNGSADNELFVLGVKLHQAHEEARAASDAFQTAYKPMLDKAVLPGWGRCKRGKPRRSYRYRRK
jgi:hypothetical protein